MADEIRVNSSDFVFDRHDGHVQVRWLSFGVEGNRAICSQDFAVRSKGRRNIRNVRRHAVVVGRVVAVAVITSFIGFNVVGASVGMQPFAGAQVLRRNHDSSDIGKVFGFRRLGVQHGAFWHCVAERHLNVVDMLPA
jgi:hypothetical protein